jgi:hypothetical protein
MGDIAINLYYTATNPKVELYLRYEAARKLRELRKNQRQGR